MQVKSVAKDVGVSAQKMRLIVDMVRGQAVDEALTMLRFAPTPNARIVAKAVKAAAADAESNFRMPSAILRIVGISADEARILKRYRASARRRTSPVLKRSSHITVIVGDGEA